MKKNSSFAVIGLGSFGVAVAENLITKKCKVAVFDKDEAKISNFLTDFPNIYAVCADSTATSFYKEQNLGSFDCVILAIASNMENAVLTAEALTKHPSLFVRANTVRQKRIYEKMKIKNIFLSNEEIGKILSQRVLFDADYQIKIIDDNYVGIKILIRNQDVSLIGKNISDLNVFLSPIKDWTIVFIMRDGKYFKPPEAPTLAEHDLIFAVCHVKKVKMLLQRLGVE